MSDCLQYQEEGASRTKKENLSIIHQARNRLYTVDQEGGSLITLEEETKSKAEQWHGHGY